jgi:hypothetical protein
MRNGRAMRALDIAEQVNKAQTWINQGLSGLADLYEYTENPSGGIAITPCTDNGEHSTFTCGLNTTGCQSDDSTWILHGNVSVVLRAYYTSDVKLITRRNMFTSPRLAQYGCQCYKGVHC